MPSELVDRGSDSLRTFESMKQTPRPDMIIAEDDSDYGSDFDPDSLPNPESESDYGSDFDPDALSDYRFDTTDTDTLAAQLKALDVDRDSRDVVLGTPATASQVPPPFALPPSDFGTVSRTTSAQDSTNQKTITNLTNQLNTTTLNLTPHAPSAKPSTRPAHKPPYNNPDQWQRFLAYANNTPSQALKLHRYVNPYPLPPNLDHAHRFATIVSMLESKNHTLPDVLAMAKATRATDTELARRAGRVTGHEAAGRDVRDIARQRLAQLRQQLRAREDEAGGAGEREERREELKVACWGLGGEGLGVGMRWEGEPLGLSSAHFAGERGREEARREERRVRRREEVRRFRVAGMKNALPHGL